MVNQQYHAHHIAMQGTELQDIMAMNIRRFRKELDMTQAELAEKAGISTGYVCDIEASRRWPSADKMARIAAELRLAPFQMFLPTEDSPYFDRHRVLSSFNRQLAEAFDRSRAEVFDRMVRAFGAEFTDIEIPADTCADE